MAYRPVAILLGMMLTTGQIAHAGFNVSEDVAAGLTARTARARHLEESHALPCGDTQPGGSVDPHAPPPRVRSEHAIIARLIVQASAHSIAFRRELEAIAATDGLVYVHEGHCGRGAFACLMMSVELAGPYRLLRVKVDLRRSELATMTALGHELQHTLEVLGDPHVRTNAAMVMFYQRFAPTPTVVFETSAAERAGLGIGDELTAYAKRCEKSRALAPP